MHGDCVESSIGVQLQATVGDAAKTERLLQYGVEYWREIAGLYSLLVRQMPSPVVRLNRAVAVAMAGDIDAGLAMIDELSGDAEKLAASYLGGGAP